jgi:hypothetical protein
VWYLWDFDCLIPGQPFRLFDFSADLMFNVLFDHFERRARFRGVQSRRTPHIPHSISRPSNLTTNQFVCFLLTLYKQEWLLNPLCTPHPPLSLFSPSPPPLPCRSPLSSPPLSCGNPVASSPLWFPSSGVRRDDRWAGAIWLPPVAREEAAGVEVVNIRLRHINVPVCVNAAAESRAVGCAGARLLEPGLPPHRRLVAPLGARAQLLRDLIYLSTGILVGSAHSLPSVQIVRVQSSEFIRANQQQTD